MSDTKNLVRVRGGVQSYVEATPEEIGAIPLIQLTGAVAFNSVNGGLSCIGEINATSATDSPANILAAGGKGFLIQGRGASGYLTQMLSVPEFTAYRAMPSSGVWAAWRIFWDREGLPISAFARTILDDADATAMRTTLGALSSANPDFTGSLSQGGTTRITSGGGALFHDVNVSATGSDTLGAGPYWQVNNHPTAATDSWIGQLGTTNDLILFRQLGGVWAELWRFRQDGSLKQAGAVRITTSGGFRGEDIKLTGLIPTAGKMTKIGADGAIIAATNYDPKSYANVGGSAGTAPAGSWTAVLGAELVADADWLDGASYELKGILQSASGGYFSTRFSVGNFKTPTVVLPTGTVYADIVVRVIVVGANVQVTWMVVGKTAAEVATTKVGTASGAYSAASAHEIAVEINPDPSALAVTTANITQRRHT